jgi:preprotein translocase SecE subunit
MPGMHSLISYLKNVRGELAHVVWPNRRQAVIHTFLIILISALVALVITGFDYVFTGIVDRLLMGV